MICALAGSLENIQDVSGLCFRQPDGKIIKNPSRGNPDKLDELPFPKRTTFHQYFGKPIASILSSRGCWRDCAFCSINAWYKQGGGKKFRFRSVENIVEEMDILYHTYGVRIFNFQDDNFFLPDPDAATRRFSALRDQLKDKGVTEIAIAVKARPDSIHENSIRVLDELGLFRVFLGVENASERGLRNLNRICSVEQILNALRIPEIHPAALENGAHSPNLLISRWAPGSNGCVKWLRSCLSGQGQLFTLFCGKQEIGIVQIMA